MSRIEIVYILSNINKAIAFEWIAKRLSKEKFHLSFLLLNPGPSDLETFLKHNNVPVQRIPLHRKRSYLFAFINVLRILFKQKPDVIHCHLFEASLIGLLAGKLLGIKKRIFTRHSGSYNWEYNRKGLKYDKIMAWLATDIVAISENVKKLLVEKEVVPLKKVKLIHHGFDMDSFKQIQRDRIIHLQENYNSKLKRPVIGVISRWLHLKGIQYIIPAFKRFLLKYPNAFLILANANGYFKQEIEILLAELPKGSYRIIPFENDLFALYQLFDIYVHTPINSQIEAFGQTYIEALAAGIPSIFTMSGVATEFIEHEKNALVVQFKDSGLIFQNMKRLMEDETLRKKLVRNGTASIKVFSLDSMISKLEKLYFS